MQPPAGSAWALLLLVAPLALAGCGEGANGVTPAQDAQGRYVVQLTGSNTFEPNDVRVPVGSTVVWRVVNGTHDVNEEDGAFSSTEKFGRDNRSFPVLMEAGDEYDHTFPEAGEWTVWCHTHHEQRMKMRLVVHSAKA